MDTYENLYAFHPPVDALLSLGEPERGGPGRWPDYVERYGLSSADIPELIRMATDEELLWKVGEGPAIWAPIHAWRALGQLRAEAAVEPLADLLCQAEEEDFDRALEELPVVFGRIGPPTVYTLTKMIGREHSGVFGQTAAARGLQLIAEAFPESRAECAAALTRRLGWHGRNDPILNGFLISYLADLGATESAPIIEAAFAANDVDLSILGDWEDAQVALGIIPERRTPRPPLHWVREADLEAQSAPAPGPARGGRPADKRAKAKRKAAEKSRRKNRRRR